MRTMGVLTSLPVLLLALTTGVLPASDLIAQEAALWELMPAGARCGSSPEPMVYCRYQTTGPLGVALEISNSVEGPSGSLTYNADDTAGYKLLGVLRRLFAREGVEG